MGPWRLMRRESPDSFFSSSVHTGNDDLPILERPIFAYMKGSFQFHKDSAQLLYRRKVASLLKKDGSSLFEEIGKGRHLEAGHGNLSGMASSRFCLEVPGDTPTTSRPFDAVFSGCIPVLLYEKSVKLPFDEDLQWDTFSLRFSLKILLQGDRLLRRLKEISDKEVLELHRRGREVRDYFNID